MKKCSLRLCYAENFNSMYLFGCMLYFRIAIHIFLLLVKLKREEKNSHESSVIDKFYR